MGASQERYSGALVAEIFTAIRFWTGSVRGHKQTLRHWNFRSETRKYLRKVLLKYTEDMVRRTIMPALPKSRMCRRIFPAIIGWGRVNTRVYSRMPGLMRDAIF